MLMTGNSTGLPTMNKLKQIINLLIVIVIAALCGMCRKDEKYDTYPSGKNFSQEQLLMELDNLLQHRDVYLKQKESNIGKLREILNTTPDDERKYWATSELYEEFSAYDSDSALFYSDKALSFAEKIGRQDFADEMRLNRSYVLSATGLIDDAAKTLRGFNIDSLPTKLALIYCDRMIFLSTHRDLYLGEEHQKTEHYAMLADSLLREVRNTITPDNPQYAWFVGWNSLNNNSGIDEAIEIVSKKVDSTEFNTRQDAMDAWLLSSLYDRKGDTENRTKYLILSAMADIKACNKEVASLEELASMLYDRGDFDRANHYINIAISNANDYKSRVRLGDLAFLQDKILKAIHARNQQQVKWSHIYLGFALAILLLLVAGVFFIWRQNRLLHKSRETLNHANDELQQRVHELSATREELNETNAKLSEMYQKAAETARELAEVNESKESYIADVFAVCSNYIDKLEGFRANLNKLLTLQNFDEAVKLTKSPELSYQEIRELWATFDEVFLDIYPNFVEDFNTLLKPEERIELKKPGHLTNELRIYALVRLGMNDSQRIARFLHCSVQTVYNTRQRTRNKAIVPRDQFAKIVMKLGKREVKND